MSVYAFSDLHGNGILWDKIKSFLGEDDKAYFLGDACDRGPDGWRILKEILADERIVFLKGNHDDLLAQRILRPTSQKNIKNHEENGGGATWDEVVREERETQISIAHLINNLPLKAEYINKNGLTIRMTHSGAYSPTDDDEALWNREHFCHPLKEPIVLVHGHTPIPFIEDKLLEMKAFNPSLKVEKWVGGAYWYFGTKCCIDCGSVWTNQSVLLNLDTFDEEIFMVEGI